MANRWAKNTGRMALIMETTKYVVNQAPMEGARVEDEFSAQRQPFEHEQLLPVDNLSVENPRAVSSKDKLYSLAAEVGMLKVLRWKPRLVCLSAAPTPNYMCVSVCG